MWGWCEGGCSPRRVCILHGGWWVGMRIGGEAYTLHWGCLMGNRFDRTQVQGETGLKGFSRALGKTGQHVGPICF